MLLKGGPVSGAPRRAFASKTRLPLQTARAEASFIALQNTLSKSSMLVHHNLERNLWIDLNAFKEFGFGAILFYVNKRVIVPDKKWPKRLSIKPLLFFSRIFSTTEKNYWLTELEIAGFIWIIKKAKYLVKSTCKKTIVQTNHSVILNIMQQSSITFISFTIKM